MCQQQLGSYAAQDKLSQLSFANAQSIMKVNQSETGSILLEIKKYNI